MRKSLNIRGRRGQGINGTFNGATGKLSGGLALGLFLCCSLSIFLFLSLLSYSPLDNCSNVVGGSDKVNNIFNFPGAVVSDYMLQVFGLSAYMVPLALLAWSVVLWFSRELDRIALRVFCLMISILSFSLMFGFFGFLDYRLQFYPGGYVGNAFTSDVVDVFGRYLGFLLVLSAGVLSAIFSLKLNKKFFAFVRQVFYSKFIRAVGRCCVYVVKLRFLSVFRLIFGYVWCFLRSFASRGKDAESSFVDADDEIGGGDGQIDAVESVSSSHFDEPDLVQKNVVFRDRMHKIKKYEQDRHVSDVGSSVVSGSRGGGYLAPSIDIIHQNNQKMVRINRKEVEENIGILSGVFNDFGVACRIIDSKVGPVVTLYELKLDRGVQAKRVIGLAPDMARSICVESVRIADIPSRGIMGIEVPNHKRQAIDFKEMLKSDAYNDASKKIPLILGKDIMGGPVVVDLASMPHLLIAGTTGSGKSVGLNGMIMSILYKLSPEECKFVMIDPKMLELSLYNKIPHLLTDAITSPDKAIMAMRWVVQEMERRYHAMSEMGVRDMSRYNEKIEMLLSRGEKFWSKDGEEEEIELKKLPYLVVVIDEMADLMLVAGKEIEGLIQRIAQMARAAGIHFIMATQRPSVNVITGIIKANLPTRISYRVASRTDSRIIIEESGAEQLLGKGDMLYLKLGEKPVRVHGPFLMEDDISNVVKDLRSKYKTEYVDIFSSVKGDDDEVDSGQDYKNGSAGDGDVDGPMYRKAIEVVVEHKRTSISYLQRQMRIGYNKAATFIERMERDGILSPPDSKGKRMLMEQN
ncbi:DNA translocase FtsK 4TM domain-containing protein [Rickettsiales bacterium]|nr:DNA translocase FtsK 4TM domain-containing protein [Rickettsiales bacterium]